MLGGKDGKLHIGMAGIFCIEYRQAKYYRFSSPITSLFFVKVLLAFDAAGNAPQLLTLQGDMVATVLTFCQRWSVKFWGVSNGALNGLLGDVIGLVDNVSHYCFLIGTVWLVGEITINGLNDFQDVMTRPYSPR